MSMTTNLDLFFGDCFFTSNHGKPPWKTSIWENMFYFLKTSNMQI